MNELWDRDLDLGEGAAAGCVFCRVLAGELPSAKVLENDDAWVIKDLNPAAPIHWLVVPRRHLPRLAACDRERHADLLGRLLATANEAAAANGLADYRVVINNGAGAGQTVPHLHIHILGGRAMGERLL